MFNISGILHIGIVADQRGHNREAFCAGGEARRRELRHVVAWPSLNKTGGQISWTGFENSDFWIALITFCYIDLIDTYNTVFSMSYFLNQFIPGMHLSGLCANNDPSIQHLPVRCHSWLAWLLMGSVRTGYSCRRASRLLTQGSKPSSIPALRMQSCLDMQEANGWFNVEKVLLPLNNGSGPIQMPSWCLITMSSGLGTELRIMFDVSSGHSSKQGGQLALLPEHSASRILRADVSNTQEPSPLLTLLTGCDNLPHPASFPNNDNRISLCGCSSKGAVSMKRYCHGRCEQISG